MDLIAVGALAPLSVGASRPSASFEKDDLKIEEVFESVGRSREQA